MTTRFNSSSGSQPDHSQYNAPAVVLAGGSAIVLGSLLPFVSFNDIGVDVTAPAKAMSTAFGFVVIALAITLRRAVQQPARRITSLATLGLSGLGCLGYAGFIALGIVGWPANDGLGDSYTVTFSPNIGVLLSLAGCVAASFAAIRSLQDRES